MVVKYTPISSMDREEKQRVAAGPWARFPAYRPGQIQVAGDRFQNDAKFPIQSA
jgi:hypothetical protein